MKMEAEAAYCLSLAYNFAGEQQTALSVSLCQSCFSFLNAFLCLLGIFLRILESGKDLERLGSQTFHNCI